jgi:hypothetical protein
MIKYGQIIIVHCGKYLWDTFAISGIKYECIYAIVSGLINQGHQAKIM